MIKKNISKVRAKKKKNNHENISKGILELRIENLNLLMENMNFISESLEKRAIDFFNQLKEISYNLEGLNEMSEMTSLLLQMTMDRRSKFISTLSNIMKKCDATAKTITQNIK